MVCYIPFINRFTYQQMINIYTSYTLLCHLVSANVFSHMRSKNIFFILSENTLLLSNIWNIYFCILSKSPYWSSLLSQCSPLIPGRHVHVYSATPSLQVPPFWHGLLAHSFVSSKRKNMFKLSTLFLYLYWKKRHYEIWILTEYIESKDDELSSNYSNYEITRNII